jgi:hypothetical protein
MPRARAVRPAMALSSGLNSTNRLLVKVEA